MEKEIYKIKHIPTGCFVQPSTRSNDYSTLGKKGKIYEGNGMWTKIQNHKEYTMVQVGQNYSSVFKDIAARFPGNLATSYRGAVCVRFYTTPEDFEKVIL